VGRKGLIAKGCKKLSEVKTEYNSEREPLENERGLIESTCHHVISMTGTYGTRKNIWKFCSHSI
jgi:hypothetical protein